MPTVVNTNLASLFAQNSLSYAQNNLATSVQRLSSGLRINSAKDDAAGLAIAQNMQSQINGTNQSVQNLSDATNLLQTADSGLSTIQDMLLKLKQLAVQGYDGSLNASQKLDIVQQMKDLNTEINQTAERTQFNGINLISSGSTVDVNNTGIKAGNELTMTAITIATTAGTVLNTGTLTADQTGTQGSITYTASLSNSMMDSLASGTFLLSASGNALTMTGTINGLATSQTVTVTDVVGLASGSASLQSQSLNFSNFGVSFALNANITSAGTITGALIASDFAALKTFAVLGNASTISDVRLQGTGPGSYALSVGAGVSQGTVTMTGTINGQQVTQSLALTTFAANSTTTLNFSSFGAQFDIKTYANAETSASIASMLTTQISQSGAGTGTLVVSQGANSDLQFQSGPASSAFIDIYTLNVMTGSSGSTAGTSTQMTSLGNRITGTTSDNLGALTGNDTISTWQTAFQNAADAADNAIDYISTQRATYGSQMNRLSYASTNLQTQSTNLSQSRSAIIDTNFASETANLTKGQIMQQAATAMLAQANQMPNVILSLLK
jgi:flagellin